MAYQDKDEFTPLLPVGFHEMSVAEVERLCVHRFPNSFTRPSVMNNLNKLIGLINRSAIRGAIWIDGSFLTEKLNPDDVDLLLMVSEVDFHAFDDAQQRFFEWFRSTSLYKDFRCDNYALVQSDTHPLGEWFYAYWLRQFGFSRGDVVKGLAVVRVPFVVLP